MDAGKLKREFYQVSLACEALEAAKHVSEAKCPNALVVSKAQSRAERGRFLETMERDYSFSSKKL